MSDQEDNTNRNRDCPHPYPFGGEGGLFVFEIHLWTFRAAVFRRVYGVIIISVVGTLVWGGGCWSGTAKYGRYSLSRDAWKTTRRVSNDLSIYLSGVVVCGAAPFGNAKRANR